jgi:hypothetical protein
MLKVAIFISDAAKGEGSRRENFTWGDYELRAASDCRALTSKSLAMLSNGLYPF